MRTRIVKGVIAVCVLLFLTGGFFYMRSNQKHERVKKRYDTYMAQLEEMIASETSDEGVLLPLIEKDDIEWDAEDEAQYAVWLKAEQAKEYLLKHAPHLLPVEKSLDDLNMELVEATRKIDPEAAVRLEAEFTEIKRMAEAEITAELAAYKQELVDFEAEIAENAKRREAWKAERRADAREAAAFRERVDKFIERMRADLIFDESGTPIGFKDGVVASLVKDTDSASVDAPSPLAEPSPLEVPSEADRSASPVADAPAVVPQATVDPRVWRETIKGEMERLDVGFYEKYPDVVIRPHLSETEYQLFFPTEESRRTLQRRTESVQRAYAREISVLLQKAPRENRAVLREGVRDDLTQQWDADFAEAVLRQVNADDK
ncbi:MAG: hypothetical protein OXI43_11725 [Candidatus Poribacteria bacterium]|nr:hypothetical protein [Candidatus Poribacteria bacterium]